MDDQYGRRLFILKVKNEYVFLRKVIGNASLFEIAKLLKNAKSARWGGCVAIWSQTDVA